MRVIVYRSSVKDGLYVYAQADTPVESLPAVVLKQLGSPHLGSPTANGPKVGSQEKATPEIALEFDLTETSKLQSADAVEVLETIDKQGFYVQMPVDIETMLARLTPHSAPSSE